VRQVISGTNLFCESLPSFTKALLSFCPASREWLLRTDSLNGVLGLSLLASPLPLFDQVRELATIAERV
jgi:hypothetical protein